MNRKKPISVKMRRRNIISGILFTSLLLAVSCQPSVRFSSYELPKNQHSHSIPAAQNALEEEHEQQQEIQISGIRKEILGEAEKWLGVPYKYGGESKSGTDCSGFTQSIMHTVGIEIPRTAAKQHDFAEAISKENLSCGDLVFFRRKDKISHVGIYTGNGSFIHASSKRGVCHNKLTDYYYKKYFAGFGRVIPDNKLSSD